MSSVVQQAFFMSAGSADAPEVVFYQGHDQNTGSATTYTFTSQPIGTAAADRHVHVGVTGRQANRSISSVTIGGITATENIQRIDSSTSTAGIFTALVPTGTTASIVVTWSGANDSCGIMIWSSTGLDAAVQFAAAGAQMANLGGGDANLDVATGVDGFIVVAGMHHNSGATSATFGPAAIGAADHAGSIGSSATQFGGHGVTDGSTFDVRCTASYSTNTNSPFVAASFSNSRLAFDGLAATGAFSFGRKVLASYGGAYSTDTSGAIDLWKNQTGVGANDFAGVTTGRPTLTTAGPNSRACADFDGTDDKLVTSALTNFMNQFFGYIAISFMSDVLATNDATAYLNMTLFGDNTGYMGGFVRNNSSGFMAYTYDGAIARHIAAAGAGSTATPYVAEWWHDGSSLYARVNGGTPSSVGIFNSASYADLFALGKITAGGGATAPVWLNGKIFELVMAPTPPTAGFRDALVADMMDYVGA